MLRSDDLLAGLTAELGGRVTTDPKAIARGLRDNSWLSPLLTAELDRRAAVEGPTLGVAAIVSPTDQAQVIATCRLAVEHRVPITPRGAGTSNFGLITPDEGGLIVDLKGMKGEPVVEDAGVRAAAGVLHGAMERVAREQGREMALLTTTYASATGAGWAVGGHVGLGSSVHGAVWDDIVREVTIVTAEDQPRVLTLTGDDVMPLLHTFGAFGIITEIVLRTEPAHDWVEAVAFFPGFDAASRFARELSLDRTFDHRVVAAQEPLTMPAFKPLEPIMRAGAGVLTIIERTQLDAATGIATSLGGELVVWQDWALKGSPKTSIDAMVYGHRMLWVRRAMPDAAFLHVYFDPADPDGHVAALKQRFGDGVVVEMKFVRSRWMATVLGHDPELPVPAAVITIVDGGRPDAVGEVIEFCEQVGIQYQNPHTGAIDDNGLFKDLSALLEFKRQVDPYNLLNPGKVRAADSWRR